MQKLEEIVNIEIEGGTSFGSVRFTPPSGLITACAIFANDAENSGFVTAKISNDSGEIISDASDIRNYRDRDAGYREGKKPLYMEACGKTYVLEINATEAWASNFKAQLVLVYERNFA